MTAHSSDHEAAHEAGHALMAYLCGDQGVSIRRDQHGWHVTVTDFNWGSLMGTPRRQLKKRFLLVCAAGEAAETTLLGRVLRPQAASVLTDLNNDAARFLIGWLGDHAIFGSVSVPRQQVVNEVHGKFDKGTFQREWESYQAQCVEKFSHTAVRSALEGLRNAALAQKQSSTPVSTAEIIDIAQRYGL